MTAEIPEADRLSRKELAQSYGYALELIYSVPELEKLFKRALNAKKGQYTSERFTAELQATNWYKENDQYYRAAWTAEQIGGADWQTEQQNAELAVQNAARTLGADLTPEETAALARRYLYEGWSDPARSGLLAEALSQEITYMPTAQGMMLQGQAGTFTDRLKSQALANGLKFNDDYYLSAARSVASGLMTENDFQRDIQAQAASMFPTYADEINAGMSVMDLASPYMTIYSQTMETSPYDVTLDNGDIRRAMMDGMGLFEFQQMLREKPEWMSTKQAEDSVADISLRVMKMFGLVG